MSPTKPTFVTVHHSEKFSVEVACIINGKVTIQPKSLSTVMKKCEFSGKDSQGFVRFVVYKTAEKITNGVFLPREKVDTHKFSEITYSLGKSSGSSLNQEKNDLLIDIESRLNDLGFARELVISIINPKNVHGQIY